MEHVIPNLLKEIQETLFTKAANYRDDHITEVNDFETFKEILNTKGGFVSAHWDGTSESEEAIKKATKATIRCIPYASVSKEGVCVFSGKPSYKGCYSLKPTNQHIQETAFMSRKLYKKNQ